MLVANALCWFSHGAAQLHVTGREEAKMNFMAKLTVKRSCVSLVCILLLVILTFYITSERREMVYYAPDAESKLSDKPNTTRRKAGPEVNKRIDKYPTQKMETTTTEQATITTLTTKVIFGPAAL
ncbi:uncharacterized protein LOC128553714 isoform X2 [Mercenaria mercenaria]|uniref:uncharacterized protein LOC128553714 isoform X2 n=1 Tax=Mercenaria mercenaria TaxID=6596 RepID=UPI00234F5366|nr:uncharacterized protein LOC128553714 isoform X2 [Mercenaria mercenaria]